MARSRIAPLLLLSALVRCEAPPSPAPQGQAPHAESPAPRVTGRRPPPRVARRTADACATLCTSRGACLARFQKLGARPLLPTSGGTCPKRCRQGAADPVLGDVIRAFLKECLPLPGCDALYGCGLRLRLSETRAHPWKGLVLRARRVVAALKAAAPPSGRDKALERCETLGPLRSRLQAAQQPSAQAVGATLDKLCQARLTARLTTLSAQLEEARQALDAKRMTDLCREPQRWAAFPGSRQDPLRTRLRTLRARCEGSAALRTLALTVRDAERDVTEVSRQLARGRLDDAAYHKCVHKAAILRDLRQAGHPRATQAASKLVETCFERFPVTWLRRLQRATPAGKAPSGGCYRARQVGRLLSGHARAPVRERNRQLLEWLRQRCPG